MTQNFAAKALLGFLFTGMALSQVAQPRPNQASTASPNHAPAWSSEAKPEENIENTNLPSDVVRARERRFRQYFASNMDDPKMAKVGSRTYIMHKPTGAIPVDQSNTILVATPSNYQPYLAENRSSVFTDLRLNVNKAVFHAFGVPEDSMISILYSGGTMKSSNGSVVRTALASGSTPLELGHRYLLFLNYEQETQSYTIVRAWDLSSSQPMLLDENGAVSPSNADLKITDESLLEAKVASGLASRPTSPR